MKTNTNWFEQGVQNLCQLCSAPRRHVRPTHIPRAPFERRSPIPERHPMFLDVHQYTTTTSRVLHDKQQFYVAMSISASARSLRAVRPVPCMTWPTRGRAGCTISSPWASTPTIPPPGRPDHGHGPRTPARTRPLSFAAAHEGSKLIFGFSTRPRAPITHTANRNRCSPFQTLPDHLPSA